MAQLTVEEKIRRIELAPAEIQTRVAKAFLREDIDDEDVQYLFNTDTIEEMNDEGVVVENLNAEEPEGIGANGSFSVRTTKPTRGNNNYITTGSGGWNTCIKGNPLDSECNVYSNCVGHASGRFNEIINEARGTTGCTYRTLNCNAEGFVERAQAAGLKTGSVPRVGSIFCEQKGTLAAGDGAGHVGIVEKVIDNNTIYTSESAYGSTAFWNAIRTNNNGRWGMGSAYTFRCFIYLPDDVQKIVDDAVKPKEVTPAPTSSSKFNIGDKVTINGSLFASSNAAKASGSISNKITIITRKAENTAHPYNTSGDLGWMNEDSITAYIEPVVQKPTLSIGDSVKIIGAGNGSSYGKSGAAYGIGWNRTVLKIWDGRPYPYQIGSNNSTTGFYQESALQKI